MKSVEIVFWDRLLMMLKQLLNYNTYILLGFVVTSVTVLYIVDETIDSPWEKSLESDFSGFRCEHVRPNNFLRERANAMSNLVFCAVGVYMMLAAVYDHQHDGERNYSLTTGYYGSLRSRFEWSIILGLASGFAGFGSFYFHASHGDPMGGKTDIASIYILVFACICAITNNTVSIIRAAYFSSEKKSDKLISLVFVILWIASLVPLWHWRTLLFFGGWKTMKIIMVVIVSIIILIACLGSIVANYKLNIKTHEKPFLLVALIWLLLAFFVWAPYEIFGDCDVFYVHPDSIFQLHALWHGAMSLAIGFFYLYFRSMGKEKALDWKYLMLVPQSRSNGTESSQVAAVDGIDLKQNGGGSGSDDVNTSMVEMV